MISFDALTLAAIAKRHDSPSCLATDRDTLLLESHYTRRTSDGRVVDGTVVDEFTATVADLRCWLGY